MQCEALDRGFGARLEFGDSEALEDADPKQICGLLDEFGLLLIRGREISAREQIALTACLGRVEPDESGAPMEMEVTNQHQESTAPDGELVFHSDYAYDPEPIPAISMYGLEIASGATPTLFASAKTVLERLPAELLERLAGTRASHACFLNRWDAPGERAFEPDPLIARGEPGWGPPHYWATHPTLWRNGRGVPMLFACLQHTDRIVDVPAEESAAMLDAAFAALYDREFVYEHIWQPGDLVIWDNLTVQHARPEPKDPPRTLRRYQVSNTDLTADYVRVARSLGIM